MATIDHAVELHKAGANVDGKLSVFLFHCRRHPLGTIGGLIFAAFLVAAAFSGWIAPHDPLATNADRSLAPPDATSIMGADVMGRDGSRIVHGARISLAVGVGSTLLAEYSVSSSASCRDTCWAGSTW